MSYLKPMQGSVTQVLYEKLRDGEPVYVPWVVNNFYTSGADSNYPRATSLIQAARGRLEKEGYVVICRNGMYRTLGDDDRMEAMEEASRRKKRAEGTLRTYSYGLGFINRKYPSLRAEVKLELSAFSNYVNKR